MTTLSLTNCVISGHLRCTRTPERIGAAIPTGILLENKQCMLTGVWEMQKTWQHVRQKYSSEFSSAVTKNSKNQSSEELEELTWGDYRESLQIQLKVEKRTPMDRCLVGQKTLFFIGQTQSVQKIWSGTRFALKKRNFNSFRRVGNELNSLNYVHSQHRIRNTFTNNILVMLCCC